MAWYYEGREKLLELHRIDPMRWYMDRWGGKRGMFEWSSLPGYANKTRWDGDRDPLLKAWRGIALKKNVGVESGTSLGKTYLAALMTLWFLDVYRGGQVVLVGPSESHLKAHLWKEIRGMRAKFLKLYPRAKFSESVFLRVDPSDIEHGAGWTAWAKTASKEAGAISTVGMQGTHAKDMLHIVDEAAGADQADIEAILNTSTAANNPVLMLGNPDSTSDPLHRFCKRTGTIHVVASALDHPNVVTGVEIIPGAVTRESILMRAGDNRENIETNLYKSRVRGLSPEQGSKNLFRVEWFEEAFKLGMEPGFIQANVGDTPAVGIDVARSEAGDEACVGWGRGGLLEGVASFQCPNAGDIAYVMANGKDWCEDENGRAGRRIYHTYNLPSVRELGAWGDNVGVDVTGVGTSTVETFEKLGFEVVPLAGSASPWDTAGKEAYNPATHEMVRMEQYVNLRAQMFFQLSDDLRLRRIGFAPATREKMEKAKVQAGMLEEKLVNNRKAVTGKDAIRAALKASPNELDMLAYWNWVRKDRMRPMGAKYG